MKWFQRIQFFAFLVSHQLILWNKFSTQLLPVMSSHAISVILSFELTHPYCAHKLCQVLPCTLQASQQSQ